MVVADLKTFSEHVSPSWHHDLLKLGLFLPMMSPARRRGSSESGKWRRYGAPVDQSSKLAENR